MKIKILDFLNREIIWKLFFRKKRFENSELKNKKRIIIESHVANENFKFLKPRHNLKINYFLEKNDLKIPN